MFENKKTTTVRMHFPASQIEQLMKNVVINTDRLGRKAAQGLTVDWVLELSGGEISVQGAMVSYELEETDDRRQTEEAEGTEAFEAGDEEG